MLITYCTIRGNIEDYEVKKKAGHDLMALQNMFADAANSHVDEWNAEWYRKHPETKNGMLPGTDLYIAYGKFWSEKCNKVFESINDRMPNSTVIGQIVSIQGEIVTIGILKSDHEKYVFLGK